jgi:hypothetical protein
MTRMRWFWVGGLASSCLLMSCSGSDVAENRTSATSRTNVIPDSVREELVRMGAEDQEIRQDLSPERLQDTVFGETMLRGDSARTARLRAIIAEYGWPNSARIGQEAAGAAFLILQHSPVIEFQEQMLTVIEELAATGEVPRSQAAMLVDRVLVRQDLPQRYGTQFKMVEGQLVLNPVEAEAQLEERRRKMGLPTMEEYMAFMEEITKAPVVRER